MKSPVHTSLSPLPNLKTPPSAAMNKRRCLQSPPRLLSPSTPPPPPLPTNPKNTPPPPPPNPKPTVPSPHPSSPSPPCTPSISPAPSSPFTSTVACSPTPTSPFTLKAASRLPSPHTALSLHATLICRGFEDRDPFIQTSLVSLYTSIGSIDTACQLFDRCPHRDVTSWNALIKGYISCSRYTDVIRVFRVMQDRGNVRSDEVTMMGVVSACAHRCRTWFQHVLGVVSSMGWRSVGGLSPMHGLLGDWKREGVPVCLLRMGRF